MYPAVCNMGGEGSVADHVNDLSEVQSKSCMGRENIIIMKTKSINPGRRKPKGINLKPGKV